MAVFIPILLMGGIVGRLFREFAITLSVAILVSMLISLTATPMMCAYLLKPQESHGRLYQISETVFTWIIDTYGRSLSVVLRHSMITLLVLLGTVGLTGYLFVRIPKGFFPQQDTGRLQGQIIADQDSSFQTVDRILRQTIDTIGADPGSEHDRRLHRRRWDHQQRAPVRLAQAARGTQSQRRRHHRPAASKAGPHTGRFGVPAGRSGYASGRPQQRGPISVHSEQR